MMRKSHATLSLVICVLALSGCAQNGHVLRQVTLPPLPADKMQPPTFGQTVRQILLQPETTQTDGSHGSRQN